jgi:hypothetical protein
VLDAVLSIGNVALATAIVYVSIVRLDMMSRHTYVRVRARYVALIAGAVGAMLAPYMLGRPTAPSTLFLEAGILIHLWLGGYRWRHGLPRDLAQET